MDREQALSILRQHKGELKAVGVVGISLFGSTARGDSRPDSDVDIAVRLHPRFSGGGFHFIRDFQKLERQLSDLLGCRVDLIEEPPRTQRFRRELDKDRAVAF